MTKMNLLFLIIILAFALTACSSGTAPIETSPEYFDFEVKTGTIVKFHSNGLDGNQRLVEYVVVPETIDGVPVKVIGHMAFNFIDTLKGVELPSSVESIDSFAFYGNKNMVSFKMGDAVKSIGDSAFKECRSLKAIEFSKTLETIGKDAFVECDSIEFLEFPDSLVRIDEYAFAFMRDLEFIDFGEGIQRLEKKAFSNSGTLDFGGMPLVIPSSMTYIGEDAFSGMIITEFTNKSSQLEVAVSEETSLVNDLFVEINLSDQKTGYYYLADQDGQWAWDKVALDQMRTPIDLSMVILLMVGVGYVLAGSLIMLGKKRMVNASMETIPFMILFFVLFIQMGINPKGAFYFNLTEGGFSMIHVIIILLIAFMYKKLRHEYNLFKWEYSEVVGKLEEIFKSNKIKYKKNEEKIGNSTRFVFADNTKIVLSKRIGETWIQMKSVKGLKPHELVLETFGTPVRSRKKIMLLSTGIKHILIGIFLIYMSGTLL